VLGVTVSGSSRVDTATAYSEIGLFQNDNDYDTISEMGHDMGLSKLAEEMQAAAKASGKSDKDIAKIHLSLYGGGSHPKVVRKHLDSGVLTNFIKTKEAKMMAQPSFWTRCVGDMFRDPCYEYVLLGACAMTLGCQLPDRCLAMLKIVYTEFSVMPDALKQMRKALLGPDAYKNGEPYDFESKSLIETANSAPKERDDDSNGRGYVMMNVIPPGGFFSTGVGNSAKSAVIKELRDRFHNPNVCASCSARRGKDGSELLRCAKCKDRRYCSADCQKKHWSIHKKVCRQLPEA
jgi:hypothetical protein